MEYELFRSKLKPLVNRALIPNIIESSSSGERPHHKVAIGLVLERSIKERRERMSKIKNTSQPDSTSQVERNADNPAAPISQAQCPASVSAPQRLSQSSSGSDIGPASVTSSTPSEPGKGELSEKPPATTTTNPSREHIVELTCAECGATGRCSGSWPHGPGCRGSAFKCAGCGTQWIRGANTCTNCHGKFD